MSLEDRTARLLVAEEGEADLRAAGEKQVNSGDDDGGAVVAPMTSTAMIVDWAIEFRSDMPRSGARLDPQRGRKIAGCRADTT